jgi:hypothetical protein
LSAQEVVVAEAVVAVPGLPFRVPEQVVSAPVLPEEEV